MTNEEPGKITLILADDHAIVREGIAAFFATRPELEIVGQCSDGPEALDLILSLKPDFAVLDLNMKTMHGLEVIRQAREAGSATKILVLSITREGGVIRELFRAGANGYILKDGPARHLFDAINFVLDGGQYLTPLLQRSVLESGSEGVIANGSVPDPLTMLSKREQEVFSLLVEGKRPKDIARMLEISPKTVDTYRANVMRKLEIEGIAGLVRYAIRRNLRTEA